MEKITIDTPSRPSASNTAPAAPSHIRVIRFDPSLAPVWESFVGDHGSASFFHGLGWKRAVERAFGHRFHGFMAYDGDRLAGVLPMHEVRSILAGRLLVSMPYATYGGIVADEPSVAKALFDSAVAFCNELGARSLELRSVHSMIADLPSRDSHATFIRELPAARDDVDQMLPRKARAAARRAAEQHVLSCTFGEDELETMWSLYSRSMRRLSSPNYPLHFFEEIVSAHRGRIAIQIVRLDTRPIAGLLIFLHRDTVMPYFVGIDERADVYGLSQYLYSESMKWGVANGYRRYDFGRSRIDNKGPFEFKRLCGFEPSVLQYQTYLAPGRSAPDLSPTSSRWSAARRVWKTLPLSVTRPLGGWLARSIPG
ncbi:MAG: FemAB family PEP-CTERM system-associated protein [Phycisphaerae bacterium]|nr:FemAB family PEP-CTERM system-associated protein [Phycisphaerae bacterium]